jgi:hypothetical protein
MIKYKIVVKREIYFRGRTYVMKMCDLKIINIKVYFAKQKQNKRKYTSMKITMISQLLGLFLRLQACSVHPHPEDSLTNSFLIQYTVVL